MAYIKKKTIRNRKNKQKGLKHKGFGAGDKVRTKIKSAATKRFDVKPSGVVVTGQANKRHRAMHHSSRQKMVQRGTTVVKNVVAKFIKRILRIRN